MWPARSTIVLLALLLANGVALLFFRFFITVDGPIHVLHASVVEDHWTTTRYVADGITYNTSDLDVRLGDLLLMGLLRWYTPEQAHDLFSVLVLCGSACAFIAFLRAHGIHTNAAILWLAPLSFNFLLIMGFFHFLLGTVICFGMAAWWKWLKPHPVGRWTVFLLSVIVASNTHRSALILLSVLVTTSYVSEVFDERRASAANRRRSLLWPVVVTIALMGSSTFILYRIVQGTSLLTRPKLKEYSDAFVLRPMLLLDQVKERPLIMAMGLLLAVALVAGLVARARMGPKLRNHDTFLLLALFLSSIPLVFDTPEGRLLYVAERCQWLALVVIVIWLTAITNDARGPVAKVIVGLSLFALPLQVMRLVQAEHVLAGLRSAHARTLQAAGELAPGSLVAPVVTDPNWLLQHMGAFITTRHEGILLTRKDHLAIIDERMPSPFNITDDPLWIPRHWSHTPLPVVDHILIIGGVGRNSVFSSGQWTEMIEECYWPTFDNGYAVVYTAKPVKANDPAISDLGSATPGSRRMIDEAASIQLQHR